MTKLKELTDDKLNLAKVTISVFEPAFSPFPTEFSKALFLRVVKRQDCGKGLTHYQTTNFRLFQTERICRRQFQI